MVLKGEPRGDVEEHARLQRLGVAEDHRAHLVGERIWDEVGLSAERSNRVAIVGVEVDAIDEVNDPLPGCVEARGHRGPVGCTTLSSGRLLRRGGLGGGRLPISLGDLILSPRPQVRESAPGRSMIAAPTVVLVEGDGRDGQLHRGPAAGLPCEVTCEPSARNRQAGHLLEHADAHAGPIRPDVGAPCFAKADHYLVLTPDGHGVIHVVPAHGTDALARSASTPLVEPRFARGADTRAFCHRPASPRLGRRRRAFRFD